MIPANARSIRRLFATPGCILAKEKRDLSLADEQNISGMEEMTVQVATPP
jgi:hypothetical protein